MDTQIEYRANQWHFSAAWNHHGPSHANQAKRFHRNDLMTGALQTADDTVPRYNRPHYVTQKL